MDHKTQKKELIRLYKKWPDIKRYLRSKGCLPSDAEDIFQEALIIFTRKCQEKDFQLDVAPFHFVKGVCKFLWYNQSRKNKPTNEIKEDLIGLSIDEDWLQKEQQFKKMEDVINSIGEKCKELLTSFYGLGLSMTKIAEKLGLRNDKVAKAQKYRCLQKAKELASSKSATSIENL
ncbi:MAG: sigma-70 family RNA polymerase sigma factor [Brumimicrobium sp.]